MTIKSAPSCLHTISSKKQYHLTASTAFFGVIFQLTDAGKHFVAITCLPRVYWMSYTALLPSQNQSKPKPEQ